MGEEAQKRNTDCVYFLASPLTCKKGSDCEYRHSEAARVNPRDCWYWLSGNCLNANCAFRHPPLDGRPGAGTSASTGGSAAATASGIVASSSSAVQLPPSTSKSAVPCFFFSQGFCSKGSKCAFLHGPPPTNFRKEAMTYRKPSEQPAAAAGNGLSSAKAQVQESKQPSLIHSPAKAAGFTPSNVYKLSTHGGGPSGSSAPSGRQPTEKTDQSAKVKLHHRGVENSRRNQSVGGRVPQVQVRDESLEHVLPAERAAPKSQPMQLDLSRGLHRQGRPSSTIHNSRTIEGFVSSELQEWASEEEAHHLNCGLDARDLRNHLKRKRNETAFASRNFNVREHPKDRLESGRLASRAVLVGDVKDLVASSSSKRVTQDKDASTFTGPKSLAQIKAEKSKAVDAHENSGGLARSSDDDLVAEVKREQSPPELCDNSSLKVCENGEQNFVDKLIVKEHETLEVVVRNKEDSGPFRESKGYGKKPVTLSSSELVPDKAVREVGSWKQRDEKLTANVVGSKVVSDSGMYFHHRMDTSEGNGTEVGYYISADDLMEDDGVEASENPVDADYLSDYEEDDFAKKLSSFA